MRSEGLLTILIFVFIFGLWLYTGGPSHPISFAGPYLTPITNVGQVSSGYGKGFTWTDAAHTVSVGGINATYTAGSSEATREALFTNASEYRGKIVIQEKSRLTKEQGPWDEYVRISVRSGTGSVNISGWKIISAVTGASATIPQGEIVAMENGSGPSGDIILTEGMEAYITSSRSPRPQSFRENKCTGYLDQTQSFNPHLSTGNCPTPRDEFQNFYNGGDNYEGCKNYLYTLNTCLPPSGRIADDVVQSCVLFAKERLSYGGCLLGHRSDTDFSKNTWRIYLGSKTPLWQIKKDTLKLVDREGKTVDVYSY